MGGGENRASSYVKRNITKSRLLYPLMTFLEQRINRDILPYLKGYRKFWKFSFVRDIELDDEQKVATTNSIKASTFLQYYQSGFPIEASMELSGLDKSKYKFDINLLEAEIMQNQLMMSGQQPGEMTAGGLEDQEAGRYGPGSESYVDAGIGDTGQGAAQFDRDPRDPSIDEEQYKKAYGAPQGETIDGEPDARNLKDMYHYSEYGTKPHNKHEMTIRPKTEPNLARREDEVYKKLHGGKERPTMTKSIKLPFEKGMKLPRANPNQKTFVLEKPKLPRAETKKKEYSYEIGTLGELQKGLLTRAISGAMKQGKNRLKEGIEKREQDKIKEQGLKEQREKNEETSRRAKESAVSEGSIKNQGKRQSTLTPKPDFPKFSGSSEGTSGEPQKRLGEGGQTSFGDTWKAKVEKSLKIDKPDTRPDQDYDPKQLADGIRVEMEHTSDPEIAKEIAKDHLDEFAEYYISLKKMENGLRKAGYNFDRVVPYSSGEFIKAKVYITHPSEAPKGRAVRRGNKGGYYYITNERRVSSGSENGSKRQPQKKKSGHARGWDAGGSAEEPEGPMMPPSPPDHIVTGKQIGRAHV